MRESGCPIQITPVIIEPIVNPLKRVIRSPSHENLSLKKRNKPPTSNPKPEPSSPWTTNHQTRYGNSYICASSILAGNFVNPC